MARLWPGALLLIVLSGSVSCAIGRYGPSPSSRISPAPRAIDRLTVDERRAVLRRAHVWRPIQTATLNLLRGPAGPGAFSHDEPVVCDYAFPDRPLTGHTPKFECAVAPNDVVKVKYGPDNGEVYAEVAATRLFWALGFAVDRMYPVRVTCRNCPADPFKDSKAEWHLGRSGLTALRLFEPATIEREYEGRSIETPGYDGWAWPELEHVSEEAGGAPRAHIDALELLAVLVQHVDSKPDQQAIKCAPEDIHWTRAGSATCAKPMLMVKDLGSTFAGAKRLSFDKMHLASWQDTPIWRDKDACVGNLKRSFIGSLSHPTIGESGRRFLADRLSLLSDAQLRDLFVAARVEGLGDTLRDDRGVARPVGVDDWVRVFKDKRAQIVNHRCSV